MGCILTAKIRRTLKAGGLVILLGIVGIFIARPFIPFGDGNAPLDSTPPVYASMDGANLTAVSAVVGSDSELEDRAGRPIERPIQVVSGDTLTDVLLRAGVDAGDANQVTESLRPIFNLRSLKIGQRVLVTFATPPHGFGIGEFTQVSLNADPMREVMARRGDDGNFISQETKRPVTRHISHYSGTIRSSLYESAQSAGIPTQIILAMIKALSYDVDFQRDIQSGDGFEVMYEGYYDNKGKLVRNGDMLFAAVTLSGRPISMYRFDSEGASVEYFNEKGESIKKALLKTPVDGAKITSGFGMRNHPILGFTKMHKGIDFGVPTGTPIQAAGDGVIEIAGPYSSYGNYVRIRHGSGYGTAYAHMSRIADGMRPGKRVSQGQTIGFVGATGRATGPHLHYEVLIGNNQINPLSVKMPTSTKLAGKELERFKTVKRNMESLMARIPSATRIAVSGKPGSLTN